MFGMMIYQNVYINQPHNLWKFGEDTAIQMKIMYENTKKTQYKIKEPSLTCSHNDTSKCVYWLDTHSIKVW